MNPIHIVTDKKNIASRVLLPGDPLRAKYIAENYLENAELINTVRNMLGYTGYYKGKKITVIGSGMGCASVCIYAYELYQIYNVKKIIRIGSAGAFNPNISVGDIVLGSYSFSFSNIRYAMCKSNAKKVSSSNNLNQTIETRAKNLGMELKKGGLYTSEIFEPYIQDKFYARMNQLNLFIFMEKALSPIRIKRINQTIKSVYNEKVARIQKIN